MALFLSMMGFLPFSSVASMAQDMPMEDTGGTAAKPCTDALVFMTPNPDVNFTYNGDVEGVMVFAMRMMFGAESGPLDITLKVVSDDGTSPAFGFHNPDEHCGQPAPRGGGPATTCTIAVDSNEWPVVPLRWTATVEPDGTHATADIGWLEASWIDGDGNTCMAGGRLMLDGYAAQ